MTKAEILAKTPYQEISKIKFDEKGRKKLIADVTALRSAYKRRVLSFKRNGLVSHAQIALEREIPRTKQVQLTEMTRNQLLLEFFRYATFFNSETSTAEGIKRLNREQDARIFGVDNKGRPRLTMSKEERILFWDTYEEYKNQFPADVNQQFSSEQTQQFIADAIFGKNSISSIGLADFLSQVRDRLQSNKEAEDIQDVPNTFSGRRDDFKW